MPERAVRTLVLLSNTLHPIFSTTANYVRIGDTSDAKTHIKRFRGIWSARSGIVSEYRSVTHPNIRDAYWTYMPQFCL